MHQWNKQKLEVGTWEVEGSVYVWVYACANFLKIFIVVGGFYKYYLYLLNWEKTCLDTLLLSM